MLFSSLTFLYCFLPLMLLCYLLMPKKLKNACLLIGSLIFYAWGEQKLVVMLVTTICIGWVLGLLIEKYRKTRIGRILLWTSIVIDLGMLFYFKYVDFFIRSLNKVFGGTISLFNVALPIGISFYTFQILSYTIDVYRGTVRAQKNVFSLATYVSFFPQLIAGPIVRYADLEQQLAARTHTLTKFADGMSRFLVGLGKKVLFANAFGEFCACFRETTEISVLYYWIYASAYMLQIYYDFSGYSDMAIGLGKLFGFDIMENFDYPYISRSITEFWRRWHISLGSWFRDYVYIPLGGNQKGEKRQFVNILIVWMLTGLWHGAAWNFVLWGLFYAVLLMFEKKGFLRWLQRHRWLSHIYVVLMVMLGFVLFNGNDLLQVVCDLKGLFGFAKIPLVSFEAIYELKSYMVVLALGIFGATPFPKKLAKQLPGEGGYLKPVFLTGILLVVTAYLVDGSFNPFLYFRF